MPRERLEEDPLSVTVEKVDQSIEENKEEYWIGKTKGEAWRR